jgi:hypothetical protein
MPDAVADVIAYHDRTKHQPERHATDRAVLTGRISQVVSGGQEYYFSQLILICFPAP